MANPWREHTGHRTSMIYEWVSARQPLYAVRKGMKFVLYHDFDSETAHEVGASGRPQFATLEEAREADRAMWLARGYAGVE